MDYPAEQLYNNRINTSSNHIYYFYTYWQWSEAKNLPREDDRRIRSERILNFKTDDDRFAKLKQDSFNLFRKCFRNHLVELASEKWIVCSIPNHDQTLPIANNVDDFLDYCKLPSNMLVVHCLITRKYETPKKHSADYGMRTYKKDLDSYKMRNDIDIKDKNIIVFDDVTTSGSSLVAARMFLQSHGANKVVCIALGKTVENNDR